METTGQFLTTPDNIEFARDLPPVEIDEFCETLGVSGDTDKLIILVAFKSRGVAMTFENLNLLQQTMGQNLHQRTDKEDLLYSVVEGGEIPFTLIPFALTRLAFLRTPRDFGSDADLEKLTNAASSPKQYYDDSFSAYPFLPTVAPRMLENACCSYARKRLQNRPGDPPTYYSRYFAMVQSSGVGKSRALHELRRNSERVFVVCVTLRQRENVGEPRRTPVVADFIEQRVTTAYDWDIFLHAVTHQLNRRFTEAGGIPSKGNSRDTFHEDLLKEKSPFWTDVVAMFGAVRARLATGVTENNSWKTIRKEVFLTKAAEEGVINCLAQSQMVLAVALDECVDALVRKCNVQKFYGLQRALSYVEEKECDMVAVVVDTNSTICNFAPPDAVFQSSGRVVGGSRLYLPFVFLDVDISRQLMETATAATRKIVQKYRVDTTLTPLPTDVGVGVGVGGGAALTVRCNPLLELLCCRPLFSTALVNRIATGDVDSALAFCRDLLNTKLPRVPVITTSEVSVMSVELAAFVEKAKVAAFSCASLRWDVTTHSPTLMQLLVSQRLALIRKVAPRMARVWCQYSFEPALARHVAEQMLRDERAFEAALAALSEVQVGGYLEMQEGRGNAGEMAATIVLCRAMDKAQSPEMAQKIAPVWLHSWLAQLFPDMAVDGAWRDIFLALAARRGVVYFHSARRIEEPLTPDVLLRYLRCGVAIISPSDEPTTTFYVPVAYPTKLRAVDLANPKSFTLGVVTVQVQNVAAYSSSTPLLTDMFTAMKTLLGDDVPLVCLVLQMHPALQWSDTVEWVPQGQTTQSGGHQATDGLGLVKHFSNGFPCLPQSSPAYGTVRSLFEDTSIDSQVLAMLQESQVQPPPPQEEATVLGPDTSLPFENRLRSLATLIGARMFHTRPDDVVEAETAEWMELGGPPTAPPPITGRKRHVQEKEEEEKQEEKQEEGMDPATGPKSKRLRTDALA
eukprot:gene11321-8047_t